MAINVPNVCVMCNKPIPSGNICASCQEKLKKEKKK